MKTEWQIRAITKARKVNFKEVEDNIKSKFEKQCEAIEEYEGIEFDRESSTLMVRDNKYKLIVNELDFGVKVKEKDKDEIYYYYAVNLDGGYIYDKSKTNFVRLGGYETLKEEYFNFSEIINNIMNKAIR